jgi:hypothetical protein
MAKRTPGLEEIAAEVGRLFGTTERHAKRWLEEQKNLMHALETVRDNAQSLISQLGGDRPFPWKMGRKKRGRPAKPGIPVIQPGMRESRKKRVVSESTKAKMAASQKKRWAGKKLER